MESALVHHFPDWKKRIEIVKRAGKPMKLDLKKSEELFFHAIGVSVDEAKELIRRSIVLGKRPEPLRMAQLLAHELSK